MRASKEHPKEKSEFSSHIAIAIALKLIPLSLFSWHHRKSYLNTPHLILKEWNKNRKSKPSLSSLARRQSKDFWGRDIYNLRRLFSIEKKTKHDAPSLSITLSRPLLNSTLPLISSHTFLWTFGETPFCRRDINVFTSVFSAARHTASSFRFLAGLTTDAIFTPKCAK